MKLILKIFFLILLPGISRAQDEKNYEDSLLARLSQTTNDTIRMEMNRNLGFFHQDSDVGKALVYHEAQLALAKKLHLELWEADAYQQVAYCNSRKFQFPQAYENYMQALKIAEDPSSAANGWGYYNFSYSKSAEDARRSIIGMIHFELYNFYIQIGYNKKAVNNILEAKEIGESLNNQKILCLANRDLGNYYFNNNKPDSAFYYYQKAVKYYQNSPYQKNLGAIYGMIGQYYLQKGKYDSAKVYYRNGYDESVKSASLIVAGNTRSSLGQVYIATGQLDSALIYTLQALKIADSLNDLPGKATRLIQLGTIYKLKKEHAIAYDYSEKGRILTDTLTTAYVDRLMQFLNLDFDQKIRLQELEKEQQQAISRNRMIAMITGLGIFLLAALLLYRNNRQKEKANKVLEKTLDNLKATQSQLVQSEKMASLGELTAGIAHEIQNPLNFVNNFSEVNKEMLEELKAERLKPKANRDDESQDAIINDLIANEEKVIHHGKRADTIVKGMLQHSRNSSGEKEPTDINALCDEYVKLAYHGLRAKDKSFNAKFETYFDENIEKLNIVPQDIGRVVLNLINNAFYAVNEKQKAERQTPNPEGYEPRVVISTKNENGQVSISVKDNGNGIPESVKEKIFQPFFTTKPAGEGTGLGLSLSYDIIKAHGGKISLNSKQDEGRPAGQAGTEFIVQLPA